MREELKPIVQMYKLNARLLGRAVDGMQAKDINRRVAGATNSILFIAGHLAETRYFLGTLIGIDHQLSWQEKTFGSMDEKAEYPDLKDIMDYYNQSHEKLLPKLAELTEEVLAAEPPTRFPFEEHTMLSAVSFLAYHEAYHVGQLNLLRVALGYESIFK